jgi:hypothetical protein
MYGARSGPIIRLASRRYRVVLWRDRAGVYRRHADGEHADRSSSASGSTASAKPSYGPDEQPRIDHAGRASGQADHARNQVPSLRSATGETASHLTSTVPICSTCGAHGNCAKRAPRALNNRCAIYYLSCRGCPIEIADGTRTGLTEQLAAVNVLPDKLFWKREICLDEVAPIRLIYRLQTALHSFSAGSVA